VGDAVGDRKDRGGTAAARLRRQKFLDIGRKLG